MKIRYLLFLAAFLSSSPSFGADDASAQSNAPVAKKASLAKKAKLKKKVKLKAKTTKKNTSKVKEPDVADASDADPVAIAAATGLYKKELAEKIVNANPTKVYGQQPQALLRSVVVLDFHVAADGELLKSSIRRSNHDRVAETTALASLREAAPLPKPPLILVRHGHVELYETWLFNKDGRFQIRSTAQQQFDR
jgi:periplasmic protein TonB